MVAGCRFRGHNQERAPQHQAGRGGDLGVEAVQEDRGRAGEARGLLTGVEPRGQIDEENDRGAERAQREDDAADAVSARVAHRQRRQRRGEQRHRQQQVGVCLARRLGGDGGWRCGRQPRVAGLPDLDRAVLDELGRRQAGSGGDDDRADRSLRRQHGAGPGCAADCKVASPQQPAFQPGQKAEESRDDRPQAPPSARCQPLQTPQNALEARPAAQQEGVCAAIRRLRPGSYPRRPDQQCVGAPVDSPRPGFCTYAHDHCTAANRCYHRPSLRLLFCSSFRRAREGLFHAPNTAVLAGRLRFLP
ncbi:MAG TPA: hypothetical protein VFT10_03570 [Solirubrobacterales bacterium]|nr:hypothetical protein [Solirubrobacterales bacterium]